jgi:hypothetical protein
LVLWQLPNYIETLDKGNERLVKNVDFSRNFSDVNRKAVAQCMKDIHSFDVSERVDGSSSGIKEV